MQQQIVEQKNTVEKKDRRFAKGMVVAVSCEIARLDNQKETYKVQSENDVNKYYIVKFMDGTPVFCSCKDFEVQSQKNAKHICKHQRAIVLAEKYGLVTTKQQKLQNNVTEQEFGSVQISVPEQSSGKELSYQYNNNILEDSSTNDDKDDNSNSSYCQNQNNVAKFDEAIIIVSRPKSYQDDDYSF